MEHDSVLEYAVPPPPTGVVRTLQGVPIHGLSTAAAVALLDVHVCAKRPAKVAIANAHTLNLARANPRYRKVLSGFMVLNDGVGVDIASRLRYGLRFPDNLNGTDFLPAYLAQSAVKLRVFMLGAQPQVVERAFAEAQRRYPRHDWVGFADGYFSADNEEALCERIRVAQPDLLLVAMGNPLQEFWIDRCGLRTGASVCVGVGALFDFLSGTAIRAPAFVRSIRLEWAWRMLQEPGRLWRRYLIGNASFLWHAWRERR